MFTDTKRSRLSNSVAAVALIVVGLTPAHKAAAQQTAAGGGDQLEEITVTSQKREQNLQQVPIAVTAFTGATLQDHAIQDVTGMAKLAPNVNLDTASPFGGSNEILSASIRGIGQDDFAINLDPGVGVYVDGIYYARTIGANANLLDVDRVEILKGPQGTLFGRNTIGGAISIVTRTPGDEYKAQGDISTGSYNRHDFEATVDVPISEKLTTSFTFSSLNRDGYQQRIPYPGASSYVSDSDTAFHSAGTQTYNSSGGQGQNILRAKILWKPLDDLTITSEADWTHVNESSVPETLLATVTSLKTPGAAFGAFYNLCVQGQFIPTVCGPRGPGLSTQIGGSAGQFAPGNAGVSTGNPGIFGTNRLLYGNQFITGNPDTTYANGPNFDDSDSFGGAVTADWEIADGTHLKAITGYRRLDWAVALDADGSPIDINAASFKEGQHQFSEELQLNGDALDGKIKYSAGLYYFNEAGYEHDYVTLGDGLLQIEGLPKIDTSSYAAYSHVDYTVVDNLTLIAGARYSYDHKQIQEFQDDLNAFDYKIAGLYPVSAAYAPLVGFPNPANPLQYLPGNTVTQNFYVFTPTLGLQYQFTPDIMGYVTYSKGYKDGGWTIRVTQPEPAQPSFGPEKAETYEAGIKSEWLEHRLQIDVAGFYTDYKGIQLNFQEGISPTIRNAGDADILGLEVESRWLIGNGFSLGATGGYIDAYYTSLENGINFNQACVQPYEPCITLGSKLPKTPKFKVSLSPEYMQPLPNGAAIRYGVDYVHTSSMFNDAINTSLLRRPTSDIVNASITYISADGHYEIVVGGTNITNDRFLTTGNEDTSGGLIYGTYNQPAEWYITLRAKL